MDIGKVKVEKLRDADNWQQWQFVVRTLLESDDLMGVCDGTLLKPEPGSQGYAAAMSTWNTANKAAKRLIVTTVESNPLQFLMNCETARDMWERLHNVFDMKSDESLSLIQKQFFEFRWESNSKIAEHISKLNSWQIK